MSSCGDNCPQTDGEYTGNADYGELCFLAVNEGDPDECEIVFGEKPAENEKEVAQVNSSQTTTVPSNLTDCEIGNFTHNQIDSLRCAYEKLPEMVVKIPKAGAPVFLVKVRQLY